MEDNKKLKKTHTEIEAEEFERKTGEGKKDDRKIKEKGSKRRGFARCDRYGKG